MYALVFAFALRKNANWLSFNFWTDMRTEKNFEASQRAAMGSRGKEASVLEHLRKREIQFLHFSI